MLENARSRRRMQQPSKQEASRLSGPEGEYKSLTQIIVSKLRKSIFDGSIFDGEYGPGSRLNITDLAKRLDVSAIPVREALRILEAEGLVEFRLNRGVVVKDLSAAELRELFLVRLPLETLAATEAVRWKSEKSLQPLELILGKMDATNKAETWHALHEKFHEALYSLSELPRLAQMIVGLRGQMRPYAKLYHDEPEQVRNVQVEHYALLKAIRKRDKEKIAQIIREHLSRPARLALAKMGSAKETISDFSSR